MGTQESDEDAQVTDEPRAALLGDHTASDEGETEHQGQPSPPRNILSGMLFWPVGKGLKQQNNKKTHNDNLIGYVNSGEAWKQGTTATRRRVFTPKIQTIAHGLGRV